MERTMNQLPATGSVPRPTPPRRCHADSGAIIVEFALILPFLALLATGIFEFGYFFRQRVGAEGAVQTMARTSSNLATSRTAEYNALLSFRAAMSQVSQTQVDYVIVYKVSQTSPGKEKPSTQCLNFANAANVGATAPLGVNSQCNIYTRAMINSVNAASNIPGFPCSGGPCQGTVADTCKTGTTGSWDQYWCPTSRNNTLSSNSGNGPDFLGVYAKVTYTNLTGLIGAATRTYTMSTVFRVEPTPAT
jgi:Flp pilus assembly protein TadG